LGFGVHVPGGLGNRDQRRGRGGCPERVGAGGQRVMAALGMAVSLRNAIARLIQLGAEIMSNHRSSYGRSQEPPPSFLPVSPVSPLQTLEPVQRHRQPPQHHPGPLVARGPIPIRRSTIPVVVDDLLGDQQFRGGVGEYFDTAGNQHGFVATPAGTQRRN